MISQATIENLLEQAKQELQIDFDDDDLKITSIIKNGCNELIRICGVCESDFEAGNRANALLLAFVRRAYDGDLSNFRNDYKSEIMTLKTESEVKRYEESSAQTESV